MRANDLREINTAAVLRAALLGRAAASRADIAADLHLTRSTVSTIVDDLLAARLLVEGAPLAGTTGRPKIPLIGTDAIVGLGAEIAADRVRVAARTLAGRTIANAETFADLTSAAPEGVTRLLEDACRAVLADLPPATSAVGLVASVPGRLSRDGRTVVSAPNLGWSDVALADLLAARPGLADLSPTLANDSDLVARHEATARIGQSFVVVHGETGIGGAIVLDGRIFRGDHGWAGEIGHLTVVPEGALCGCGRRGCLEAYAGFHAVRRALGLPEGTHLDDLATALGADDPAAHRLLESVGAHLGAVLASVLTVLDLSTVVLSGYFRALAPQLIPSIQAVLAERSLRPDAAIEPATGDGRHEADGAAREALDAFWRDVTGWMARDPVDGSPIRPA